MLVELMVLIDSIKRASCKSLTVVLPIYPYQRQDRKPCSRSPISASMIAKVLKMQNVNRVICFDLHAGQIQGFFLMILFLIIFILNLILLIILKNEIPLVK